MFNFTLKPEALVVNAAGASGVMLTHRGRLHGHRNSPPTRRVPRPRIHEADPQVLDQQSRRDLQAATRGGSCRGYDWDPRHGASHQRTPRGVRAADRRDLTRAEDVPTERGRTGTGAVRRAHTLSRVREGVC